MFKLKTLPSRVEGRCFVVRDLKTMIRFGGGGACVAVARTGFGFQVMRYNHFLTATPEVNGIPAVTRIIALNI